MERAPLTKTQRARAHGRPGVTHPLPLSLSTWQRLSLASCCLTTAAAPAIAGLQVAGAAGTPAGVAAQMGVAAAIAAFGAFTTGENGEHKKWDGMMEWAFGAAAPRSRTRSLHSLHSRPRPLVHQAVHPVPGRPRGGRERGDGRGCCWCVHWHPPTLPPHPGCHHHAHQFLGPPGHGRPTLGLHHPARRHRPPAGHLQ